MLAKLIIEGKEFDIEILDPKLQELIAPKKKTGYERVKENNYYWVIDPHSQIYCLTECDDDGDEDLYDSANYYESEVVAGRNARADTLMRQLRRFSVEHRENELDFTKTVYWIGYDFKSLKDLAVLWNEESLWAKSYGIIYFDSKKAAQQAIDTFYDELIWYFTEYKDCL